MKKQILTLLFLNAIIIAGFSQAEAFITHTVGTTASASPYVIASGHLNSGSHPDIVVGTQTNSVEIYINNEDDTFAAPMVKTLTQVNGVHIADLDGINGNDILATSYDGDKLVWYANNGDGTFADEAIISSTVDGPGTIVTGFIDSDTTLDIALAVYGGDGDTDRVIWFANDGLPWTEQDVIPATAGLGCGNIDIADVDGDTDLDIVVANVDTGTVELYYNNYNPLTDNDPVSFTESAGGDISTGNTYLFGLAFGDVNDDSYLDILKVDLYGPQIAYYQNDGSGTFSEVIVNNTHPYPSIAFVADLNNDSYNDIIAADGLNANDDVFWFESDAVGGLGSETIIRDNNFHNQVYGFTINDFDNDGDIDIATIGYQDNRLKWIENELNLLSIPAIELSSDVSIYPNPTSNRINFKGITEKTNVSVYDILGKKIISQSINVNQALDVSKLQNGIYILRLDDLNSSFKFVKE
ncbi:T9SS type A sorting domain-containing protein [Xanthomarina spongicola]|uniref:Putative secreted protein (Por secretion system target) n=1 Tax=Xanthomarina spongicola TaxID=570520 RepID=A0A316DNY2_9FLAO|nr:T9SS type A sorting domain-containing protein [Xanthomarina spongicola]PWK19761.1 putative secreted protein (Por secretion system target) [Xanthomarina spongicola]